MLFAGTFEHSIDAKQRLAIPAEIRDRMDPEEDGRCWYAVLTEGPTLCLYTEAGFKRLAARLDYSQLPPEVVLEYERIWFSLARPVELDKQGRVRLPEHLLKLAKLGGEVVIIGVKDHLEIRDRALWTQHMQRTLTERQELLMNPRRMIGSPPPPPSWTQ